MIQGGLYGVLELMLNGSSSLLDIKGNVGAKSRLSLIPIEKEQ